MKCKCNNNLIFNDNSIRSENGRYGEVIPLYYCDNCNVIYDGEKLDLNGNYVTINNEKYRQWFK